MDELLKVEAWITTLDFSNWYDAHWNPEEDEQMRWLAERDRAEFDSQWMRVFAFVRSQEEFTPLSQTELEKLEEIRKIGYVMLMKWALVNEIAAYGTDDFELIARAARLHLTDFWLDKLRAEYDRGRFPHGPL